MGSARSDQELLDLWHRGDLIAGEELFDRYYDLVYRFFAREVTSDLTPLVQATFDELALWRSRRPGTSFRVTLLANAYRALLLHLDGTRDGDAIRGDESTETDMRTRSAPDDAESSTIEVLQSSTAAGADLPADQRDQRRRRRALRTLAPAERTLFELHDVEALSELEIAEVLDVPVTSVRGWLRHAMMRLDQAMALDEQPGLQDSSDGVRLGPSEEPDFDDVIDASQLALGLDDDLLSRPVIPRGARSTVRLEIVLDGDIAQVTPDTLRRLRVELERSVPAGDLTPKRIRPGSIIVELEASPETAAMLEKLIESGDLKSLGGLRILAIKRVHAELPGTARGTEGVEAALADFLVSAFAADELRRFVHGVSDGARLEAALPGAPVSLSHLAFEAARVLIRHGLVCPALFERLEAERPGRRDEIHRLRQAFEHAADAAPARPPP